MPIRILHVMGGMKQGGAETWRMHMLRRTDRHEFQMDFLVHTDKPCAYDDEIRALGSKVIPCLHPHHPWMYAQNFRRLMAEHGPYDIIHSGVHHFSGYVLRLAAQSGIKGRIAHSHNASPGDGQAAMRPAYLRLMRHWVKKYATAGLAVSTPAAVALFGENWRTDSRWQLHYNSRDLTDFKEQVDRGNLRRALGLPDRAFVVGHVGRFDTQKNHDFLIRIAHELMRCRPDTYLLLVGDGPRKERTEELVKSLGIAPHVVFAGLRSDVSRLMLGAMDCFVLPSLHEGLPGVAIEAQAAGLPIIMADTITPEAAVSRCASERLSLSRSPAVWAAEIMRMCNGPLPARMESLKAVAESPFNIDHAHDALLDLYRQQASVPVQCKARLEAA